MVRFPHHPHGFQERTSLRLLRGRGVSSFSLVEFKGTSSLPREDSLRPPFLFRKEVGSLLVPIVIVRMPLQPFLVMRGPLPIAGQVKGELFPLLVRS